jgi:hypothetical protein
MSVSLALEHIPVNIFIIFEDVGAEYPGIFALQHHWLPKDEGSL